MRRRITKILIAFVLSLFLCFSSVAQNKIAVIESRAFDVEEQGITELIIANKKLEEEFELSQKELRTLNEKIWKICGQFGCSGYICHTEAYYRENKEKLEKAALDLETFSKRIKEITDEITPQIEKRKVELVEPINKRIAEKLELYRTTKGYKKIFDLGDDKIASAILGIDISIDITNDFIRFCNEEFEKEKTAK